MIFPTLKNTLAYLPTDYNASDVVISKCSDRSTYQECLTILLMFNR
jgi:hypothetical protein